MDGPSSWMNDDGTEGAPSCLGALSNGVVVDVFEADGSVIFPEAGGTIRGVGRSTILFR